MIGYVRCYHFCPRWPRAERRGPFANDKLAFGTSPSADIGPELNRLMGHQTR